MRGEALIEVLIALTVAVVVISTVTIINISSSNNAKFVKDQSQASKYAQEGMEVMRSIRNNNYGNYKNYSGTYCLSKDQAILGSAVSSCQTANIDSQYIRFVQIQQNGGCGATLARTTVTVAWTSTKCSPSGSYCHSSELTSCFSTIPPIIGP